MPNPTIHLISFDQPSPPTYGGIIDVFFKIKALKELGYRVYLHCFYFQNKPGKELDQWVEKVYYYKINQSPFYILNRNPLSICSRNGKQLAQNISQTKAPILFESLKTIDALRYLDLDDFPIYLRLHNLEQDYFKGIAKSEKNHLKKYLFLLEGYKYKKIESVLGQFKKVFTLSRFENEYVNSRFQNACFIPVFHGNKKVTNLSDFGEFALYHGDLRGADNQKVARFLIDVFKELDYPLHIASSTKPSWIDKEIEGFNHIHFTPLRDFNHLLELFERAHLNISWSFQQSGTKLKVINALFNSRFSIINANIIDDQVINELCVNVASKDELITKIQSYRTKPYDEFEHRKNVLEGHLNDQKNIELMMNQIFP